MYIKQEEKFPKKKNLKRNILWVFNYSSIFRLHRTQLPRQLHIRSIILLLCDSIVRKR